MSLDRLNGKKVLITASAQGIGRASAVAMAKEGAKVIATDKNDVLLEALRSIPGITTSTLDVIDKDAIIDAADKFQDIDAVVNCAGLVHHGDILHCDDSDWNQSIELNVTSMFHVIKAFLPNLIKKESSSVVNIASVAGSIKGIVNRFAYGTTKAAVIGLTKSIAADYVNEGLRANAICPGTVDTPSLSERIKALGDEKKAREAFIARQPMRRLGQPEEIANMVVYLVSDESRFMTGQSIIIDGGITT
jgi:2-keto-3-deoxy-L-fuconate dehydrogenase